MTPAQRLVLLRKMCDKYEECIRHYSHETAMAETLALAERMIEANETPESERVIPYARSAPSDNHEAALAIVIQWLRYDVPRSTRALITAELCHALARRLSFLGR